MHLLQIHEEQQKKIVLPTAHKTPPIAMVEKILQFRAQMQFHLVI